MTDSSDNGDSIHPPTTITTMSTTDRTTTRAVTFATRLVHQCRLLLAELDAFLSAIATRFRRSQQQQHLTEMRQLRSSVLSELRTLERLAADARAIAIAAEKETETAKGAGGTEGSDKTPTGGLGRYRDSDSDDGSSHGGSSTEAERRLMHTLRSSNLPFYAAVWTITKERCKGVVAFGKRFYWDSHDGISRRSKGREIHKYKHGHGHEHEHEDEHNNEEEESDGGTTPTEKDTTTTTKGASKDKRKSVFVDIVADNGEEWVKVSTITENRLLFEMAEKGWDRSEDEEDYDNDSDEEHDDALISGGEDDEKYHRKKSTILRQSDNDTETDDDEEIELVKLASDMTKAARAVRVRYRHPRVRFVIPKLVEGRIPEIDGILNEIRSYGVTVECGIRIPDVLNDEMDGNRNPDSITPEDLPLSTLLPNPYEKFTATLNVDCTLLLALVSDLSNIRHITRSPSYHRAIIRQMELEEEQPLLPSELWPAMVGRHLVCSEEAAKRMREIVDTIGTDTEKERTAIIMGDPVAQRLDKDELLQRFQRLSDHEVPHEWLIPIKVVNVQPDINAGLQDGKLPPVAHKVTEVLSAINRSVFLYGWVKGIVTVTSNRTVNKQIENVIEENRDGDNSLEGPPVWVCDTARSLVGKDKNRKP